MTRLPIRRLTISLVLFAAACGRDGGTTPADVGARVDTVDGGRVRVVNAAPAWASGEAWRAVEDLRLGVVDGDGPEQFGQIAAIETDSEGRIYVLDFMSQDVRVFLSDGTWSHTIGRRGEGPGEFDGAAGLNWSPDGSLWVWDPTGRFTALDPDGTLVGTRPRRVQGVVFPWRGGFAPDGTLIDWGLDYPDTVVRTLNSRVEYAVPTRAIYHPVRFTGDFERGDTLPPLEFEFELTDDGNRAPFGEGLSLYQDQDGTVWFARTRAFTLYRRTLEGDTILESSIDARPVPVTSTAIDSVRESYIAGGNPEFAPAPDDFPATKPMIRRIFGDDAGHVFVLSEQEGMPLGTFVDVFRDTGRYLGRIELPAPVHFPYPPPHATESHLYYVTTDEFGVEYVVRARWEKGAGTSG